MASQLDLFLESELAAELYVDDKVDGQGLPIACLTEGGPSVRVDRSVSVSGLIRFDSPSQNQLTHVSEILRRSFRHFLGG